MDLLRDPADCGSCGRACGAGEACEAGACASCAPLVLCGAACTDTNIDVRHCGSCGRACGPGESCRGGLCCPGADLPMRTLLALCLFALGCAPDPGACDEAAAYEVYYDEAGFPAYAGQALLEVSCGQGRYCHASGITDPTFRFGVPAGLELDVGVAVTPEELPRLAHARRVAWNLRGEILQQLDLGAMPPGPPSGDEALAGAPRYRAAIGTPDEHGLPAIGTPEAREMLRNWLACGAQVVEAPSGTSTGIGDIVPAIEVLACGPGQAACDGACLDVSADPANCGACGRTCGAAQGCVDGVCTCAAGLTACGADCFDLTTDVSHCGACGNDCGTMFCAASVCTAACPAGSTDCGGSCVDLATSASNCGGCGRRCLPGEACSGGSCACTGGTTACGGACADLATDPANCGTCGSACGAGEACVAGRCACPTGTTDCGGTCVDVATDAANCGACGNACGAGGGCLAGACVTCGASPSYARDIEPIFVATCRDAGCHTGARAAAGLRLDLGVGYAELLGVPASCGGSVLVRPSDVAGSYLFNKLTNVGICSGTEMPKRGSPLAPAQIDLIRAWICSGAAP